MEDSLQFSAIENEESLSILCASLDAAKQSNMDELTEVQFLVGKLSGMRDKYDSICQMMADEMDVMKMEHSKELSIKESEYNDIVNKLEADIAAFTKVLKSKELEMSQMTSINTAQNSMLLSIRAQIDEFFDQYNHNHNQSQNQIFARQPNEVVTLDSDSDDEHDTNCEVEGMLQNKQPDGANGCNDQVQNDGEAPESENENENVEQSESVEQDQLTAAAHDETANPNDEAKENVRPQSTPIAKADSLPNMNVVANEKSSSIPTRSVASSVDLQLLNMVSQQPLIEKKVDPNIIYEAGSSNKLQSKKLYPCPKCDETFGKLSILLNHLKIDHKKKPKYIAKKKVEKPFESAILKIVSNKRKYTAIQNEHDENADDIENVPENSGGKFVLANPMKQSVKRQKEST